MVRLSIITVTYNAGKDLPATRVSFEALPKEWYEWVVVDGGSTDGTVAWLQACPDTNLRWVSEPDRGIYDAMNKGLRMAAGEYVWFLNAGDFLHHPGALASVLQVVPEGEVFYGDTEMIRSDGQSLGIRRGGVPEKLTKNDLLTGMLVSHQSVIVRRNLAPEFDLRYRIVGDLDWMIRILAHRDIRVVNLHQVVSRFATGGTSGKHWRRAMLERWNCLRRHFGFWPTLWAHVWIILKAPFAHLFHRH